MIFRVRRRELPTGSDPPGLRGLGDAVALVAEPVKRAMIELGPPAVRRWLERCNCAGRRELLNRLVPFR